jgi:hypothetical protein
MYLLRDSHLLHVEHSAVSRGVIFLSTAENIVINIASVASVSLASVASVILASVASVS